MLQDHIKQKPNIPLPPIPMPPINNPSFLVSETCPQSIQKPDPPALQQMSMFEYKDRYEYSPGDSELWLKLFQYTDYLLGQDVATMLEYIRNTGAILQPSEKYGYIIKPVIGIAGWSSMEEYEQERLPLMKYQMQIIQILKKL